VRLSSYCTRSWHNTSNHRLCISSASRWQSLFGRATYIAKRTMTYSLSYDISCVCFFHCLALVAILDGCSVGKTWELLSLLQDARGLSGKNDIWCKCNAWLGKLFSLWVLNLVSRLVVNEVPGGSARWRLGRIVFINQRNSQVEPWTKKSLVLEYIYAFFPLQPPFSYPLVIYTLTASWSRHQVTWTKQRLLFQNTHHNLHNSERSLWASFRYTCIIMLRFQM